MVKFRHYLPLLLITALCSFWFLPGCKKSPKETNYTYEIQKVRHSFLASYKYAVENHEVKVNAMRNKANQFYSVPVIAFFNQLRESWISSWHSYQLMKPFSLMQEDLNSPINFNRDRVENVGFNLSFLDSTLSQPNSGIVYDEISYPTISSATISLAHSSTSSNKTIGYQVAEFMLWGEDNSVSGGGARSHYDFASGNTIRIRRRSLLTSSIVVLGSEFNNYYNSDFENTVLTSSNDGFLRFIFSGILDFIENDFANDVLFKPYNSQNQSDELSRFSENTLTDIKSKLSALELLLNGSGIEGSSNAFYLIDLIGTINPDLKDQINADLAECQGIALSIQGNFDNAITSSTERPKIFNLYTTLLNISMSLRSVLTELEISL